MQLCIDEMSSKETEIKEISEGLIQCQGLLIGWIEWIGLKEMLSYKMWEDQDLGVLVQI